MAEPLRASVIVSFTLFPPSYIDSPDPRFYQPSRHLYGFEWYARHASSGSVARMTRAHNNKIDYNRLC